MERCQGTLSAEGMRCQCVMYGELEVGQPPQRSLGFRKRKFRGYLAHSSQLNACGLHHVTPVSAFKPQSCLCSHSSQGHNETTRILPFRTLPARERHERHAIAISHTLPQAPYLQPFSDCLEPTTIGARVRPPSPPPYCRRCHRANVHYNLALARMASPSGRGIGSPSTSSAALLLGRQFKQMQTDKDIPGISCGLVGNSVFEWEVMLMLSDEQDSLYGGANCQPSGTRWDRGMVNESS